jgi:peptidoglycan/LPS O-acetylase OafA/YrhL
VTPASDPKRLPALDGMRAIAVFVVIVGHANYPVKGVPADLGVNLFFVLSGFLITRILLKEFDQSGRISFSSFYYRRTLRIFPAYYAFLAVSFALDRIMHDPWPTSLTVSAVTYTVNYFNALHGHPTTSIAHAWSLAVEEQFYLLWPLALVVLIRRGWLFGGTLAIALVALAWRTILVGLGADVAYVYNAFDTRMDCLAIGCLVAIAAKEGRGQNAIAALSAKAWHPLVTMFLLLVSRWAPSKAYHYSLGFTVEAILCALLLIQVMRLAPLTGWKWLDHPVMRYLGLISYPMYLYHAIGGAFGRRAPFGGEPVEFIVTVLATIGLATGSYYVIERPFLRRRDAHPVATRPAAA